MTSLEEAILKFAHEVGRAKTLARTGWKEKAGIESPESIAEHMYRTAVISMVLSDVEGLDTEKVLRMALLDDLAETLVGDLTPSQKKSYGPGGARRFEEKALRQLLSTLPEALSAKYVATWKEAQSLGSQEARLVKSSDKLEMAIQAQEYTLQGYDPEKLEEFIKSAGARLTAPRVKRIYETMKRQPKVISRR